MKTIIFVCHGNICRSVAAEYIAKDYIKKNNLENEYKVFSRATSLEEIGNDIYPPMKRELSRQGIKYAPHFAERITQRDYDLADYVFYMDENNRRNLGYLIKDYKNIVMPITKYTDSISFIEDPWYSDHFEKVVNEIRKCIEDIFMSLPK